MRFPSTALSFTGLPYDASRKVGERLTISPFALVGAQAPEPEADSEHDDVVAMLMRKQAELQQVSGFTTLQDD